MSVRPAPLFAPLTPRALVLAVLAMGAVVLLSNVLVQYPINGWLTWGAFSYPVAFLVSNLINRRFGPGPARRVAWIGFAVAVLLSIWGHPAHRHCLVLGVHRGPAAGHHRVRPPAPRQLVARTDGGHHLQRDGGHHPFWSIAFAGSTLPWVSWPPTWQ